MSDSSDDENLELLREAADSQFLSDAMFSGKSTNNEPPENKVIKLPSLRKCKDEDEQFNLFRVTPEFRKHVAKHLSTMLDDKLQQQLKSIAATIETNSKTKRKRKGGVKLLSDSEKFLRIPKESDIIESSVTHKPKKLIKTVHVDDEDLKQVSVKGEDILCGKETEKWSKRCKRKPLEYKRKKNGVLEFVPEKFV